MVDTTIAEAPQLKPSNNSEAEGDDINEDAMSDSSITTDLLSRHFRGLRPQEAHIVTTMTEETPDVSTTAEVNKKAPASSHPSIRSFNTVKTEVFATEETPEVSTTGFVNKRSLKNTQSHTQRPIVAAVNRVSTEETPEVSTTGFVNKRAPKNTQSLMQGSDPTNQGKDVSIAFKIRLIDSPD
jgi:hypothetical protein